MTWRSASAKILFVLGLSLFACSGRSPNANGPGPDLKPAWWVSQADDGLSFSIQDTGGNLTGVMWVRDPDSGSWIDGGDLSGSRSGNHVHWTAGIVTVDAQVNGSSIAGTATYAAFGGDPGSTEPFAVVETAP